MARALPISYRHRLDRRPGQEDFAKSIEHVERKLRSHASREPFALAADFKVDLAVIEFKSFQPPVKRAAGLAALRHLPTPVVVFSCSPPEGNITQSARAVTLPLRNVTGLSPSVTIRSLAQPKRGRARAIFFQNWCGPDGGEAGRVIQRRKCWDASEAPVYPILISAVCSEPARTANFARRARA